MASDIVSRIARDVGFQRLLPALADDLSPADLQSLLLAVFQRRAARAMPSDLQSAGHEQALFAPSTVDARTFNTFDRLAFEAAAAFEAVDLGPVSPLATSAVLGDIDQNNVLTTIRRAEVLGDNTSALALAAAARRQPHAARTVAPLRLCSSQRVVRLQPFDVPGFSRHFRLFALASAGRTGGTGTFATSELRRHVAVYLRLFRALNEHGFSLTTPRVEFSDARLTGALLDRIPGARDRVREAIRAHRPDGSTSLLDELDAGWPDDVDDPERLDPWLSSRGLARTRAALLAAKREVVDVLAPQFPEATFHFTVRRLEGVAYYSGLCLRIAPATADGHRFPVVDGGVLDWTARLLQDRKECFLATGIGEEFVCKRYRISGGS